MGWSFHYRLSPLSGPALYNIEFNGERVVYEIGLADIAVFYSGHAPFSVSKVDHFYILFLYGYIVMMCQRKSAIKTTN